MHSPRLAELATKPRALAMASLASASLAVGVYFGHQRSGDHTESQTPAFYDISGMGCDPNRAVQTAQIAVNQRKPLVAEALRTSTKAVQSHVEATSVDAEDNINFLPINPLVLTCRGVITWVLGIDRGFTAQESTMVISIPAKRVTFNEVVFSAKYNTNNTRIIRIPPEDLRIFLVKDKMVDRGPSQSGVAGLASTTTVNGYGIMP